MAKKYRIERTIPGGFRDALLYLWEGDGLPSFGGRTPYLFGDRAVAERITWRLSAKYPETLATPHFPAQPITYSVVEHADQADLGPPKKDKQMTKQSPNGRYRVFSLSEYRNYPEAVPAGRYDNLRDATHHADSVTYAMGVIDSMDESRGFVYVNAVPKSRMAEMVEKVLSTTR